MSALATLTSLVGKVSTMLTSPIVPAAVAIGEGLIDYLKDVKETASETDAVKLQDMIDDLEPKVLAHADATEAKLRGA